MTQVAVIGGAKGPARQRQDLPFGYRSPKGKLRWYFVSVPDGRGDSVCRRLRAALGPALVEDAFAPKAERIRKFSGEWRSTTADLFRGYAIVATRDARELGKRIGDAGAPAELVGAVDHGGYVPLSREVQDFLAGAMDADHTVPNSVAEIVGDDLHVLEGPLVGREGLVSSYRRAKGWAQVELGGTGAPCTVRR